VAPRGPAWHQRSIARPTRTVAQDRRGGRLHRRRRRPTPRQPPEGPVLHAR